DGQWLLARDLDTLSLADLYEASGLRIPVSEAWLPYRDDPLGADAVAALDELRLPLRDLLKRNVADLYPRSGATARTRGFSPSCPPCRCCPRAARPPRRPRTRPARRSPPRRPRAR